VFFAFFLCSLKYIPPVKNHSHIIINTSFSDSLASYRRFFFWHGTFVFHEMTAKSRDTRWVIELSPLVIHIDWFSWATPTPTPKTANSWVGLLQFRWAKTTLVLMKFIHIYSKFQVVDNDANQCKIVLQRDHGLMKFAALCLKK
jgi:hypothetical protein